VFKPSSGEQLASVGDDQCLLLWDTRTGNSPATRVAQVPNVGNVSYLCITLGIYFGCRACRAGAHEHHNRILPGVKGEAEWC